MTDNTVLLGIATPIAALMVAYFAYALIVFRHRDSGPDEGVAVRGNSRVVVVWLVVTGAIVLFAAAYGTAPPLRRQRIRGRTGVEPDREASGGHPLQVQVIGQQWNWTYRFPSYGGVETPQLELPVDTGRGAPRHLARRDPFVLGRMTSASRPMPTPASTTSPTSTRPRSRASTSAAPSSAGSSTATCSRPATSSATPVPGLDQTATAAPVRAGDQEAEPLPTRPTCRSP